MRCPEAWPFYEGGRAVGTVRWPWSSSHEFNPSIQQAQRFSCARISSCDSWTCMGPNHRILSESPCPCPCNHKCTARAFCGWLAHWLAWPGHQCGCAPSVLARFRVELGIWIVKGLSACELLNRAKWLSALVPCSNKHWYRVQEHVVLFSCLSHAIGGHPSALAGNGFEFWSFSP
jgi:hypothetical protein